MRILHILAEQILDCERQAEGLINNPKALKYLTAHQEGLEATYRLYVDLFRDFLESNPCVPIKPARTGKQK